MVKPPRPSYNKPWLTAFFVLIIFLISFFGFSYKVSSSYRMPPDYNYDSDFGRDLWMMEKIIQGKQTLVGPQFSFSGLRLAPYHFYLFAPILAVFGTHSAVVYANAVIFSVSLVLAFFILKKRYGMIYSFLSVMWVATTPFIILAARTPGNAFTYLSFLILYLAYLATGRRIGPWVIMGLGLVGGIMVNYHPVSLPVVLGLFMAKEILIKDKFAKKKFMDSVYYFFAFGITFLPVILFEIKHGFVLLKTFLGPGQGEFITRDYLKGIASISQMTYLNSLSFPWIPLTLFGLLLLLTLIFFGIKEMEHKNLYNFSVFIAVLYFVFGRTVSHYFFPTILCLQMIVIIFVKRVSLSKLVMIVLIALNLAFFPVKFYQPARSLAQIEKNLNIALKKITVPKSDINIFLVNETSLSAPGYEYRYLLAKNGMRVDDEYSYNTSKNLLLISEKGPLNWQKMGNWEMTQFGMKKLVSLTKINGFTYYLFKKYEN